MEGIFPVDFIKTVDEPFYESQALPQGLLYALAFGKRVVFYLPQRVPFERTIIPFHMTDGKCGAPQGSVKVVFAVRLGNSVLY